MTTIEDKTEETMNRPPVVSRDEWRVTREELLEKEKEATRAIDALAAERRRLPMVRLDTDYVFEGPDGTASFRIPDDVVEAFDETWQAEGL
jgi:predicted dithiol-disulfide oxidoreductase (DUF899 family)